jgi:hypothetical protein
MWSQEATRHVYERRMVLTAQNFFLGHLLQFGRDY